MLLVYLMEHNCTYIFQELSLLTYKRNQYDSAETNRLTKKANHEIFLLNAKNLGGEIIKQRNTRSLICFDKLVNAEEYIFQMQHLLKEFKKQKNDFYFEHTSFIWSHNSRNLNTKDMIFLKKVSNLLGQKKGNYCSQRLGLKSHSFGKIVIEENDFYICQLIPTSIKSTKKKQRLRSVRVLGLILICGFLFVTARELLNQLKNQFNSKRYSKIEKSLDSSKPLLTYQMLKNIEGHYENQKLEDILYRYIEKEWKEFLELPFGSSSRILNDRIGALLKVMPWSKNLMFFSQLLSLSIEFEDDKIPLNRLKAIFYNSSSANRNKVIILINFCFRYNLNPFFLSSELQKLKLKSSNTTYLYFLEACLRHDIKGKELELIEWFKKLPELQIQKYLQSWMTQSTKPLNKNSFILLIKMQELNPNFVEEYIQKQLNQNFLPIEEIKMLVFIKDSSSREIVLAFLEKLVRNLKRKKLYPEVQEVTQSVLVRMSQ